MLPAMSASPDWLRTLASGDGKELPPTMSIRPALAGHLAAARAQWLRRRTVAPQAAPTTPLPAGGDARRLADVLDPVSDGDKPYALLGLIGSGGMGVVHLARQRSTGREVAVKAIHPERLQPAYLDAFRQECRTTAALEHPHIVPVYDAGADFMVMKRLTGKSLEAHLRHADVPLTEHIEVLIKVCDAMTFAHSRGVIHRDLKGENVFVGSFGEVWVMDWGLAAAFAADPDGRWLAPAITDAQGMCAGTPMCVPPEVATGDLSRIGPGIDLFLLGALLYRVLCGHYPYESASSKESLQMAARRELQPLLVRAPGAPFRLLQAAERATAWDPDDRGSVATFASDLKTWLHTSGATSEAHALLERAIAHLAAGERETSPEPRYRALGAAMAEAQRAMGLCPELRGAHELLARARKAFAAAAAAAGDKTLAHMVGEGFTPPAESSGGHAVLPR
jgi:serine/threonine protein kinase